MSVAIILPTLNEANNIDILIEDIEKDVRVKKKIIIIDDNSVDGTRDIIYKKQKKYDNIILLEREFASGLGSALKEGFNIALSLKNKPEYIISMDADLSHNPNQIENMIKLCDINSIVVGSRYIKNGNIVGWSIKRKIISKGANFISKNILSIKVNDCTSGYRCYGYNALKKIVNDLSSNGYDIQIEALYKATKKNIIIKEAPIEFKNRVKGISKMKNSEILNLIKTTYKLLHKF